MRQCGTREPRQPAAAVDRAVRGSPRLATLGLQVVVEVIRLIPGTATFEPLDIVASVAGMLLGALLYRRVAPYLRYATHGE